MLNTLLGGGETIVNQKMETVFCWWKLEFTVIPLIVCLANAN